MLTQPAMMHANMANTGYLKLNTKDLVTVIHEETADKVDQSQLNAKINLSGSRGQLAGYEQAQPYTASSVTVGYKSNDYVILHAENQTAVTVNVDGGNISDINNACAVKILRIVDTQKVKTLTFNPVNGIKNIDYAGESAPILSDRGVIFITLELHDITATVRIDQY